MPTPIRVLLKFVPRKPFKCKREEVEKRFRLKVPPQKDPFPVGNWVIGFNFTSDGKTHHVLAKWTWSCSICTPQELVQWRTTTSLGKKYNEFFIDPVQDSKVKQWYKLTTRCILGMSSKNIRSDLSTTFAKTWRARNKPPFLFLPLRCSVDSVALVWPAPSYSVTQWLLKQLRDTSNSDAYSWTVGSVHHYARVNWKAYHHIKASGIRSTSSFQAVFIPAPLHSFSCKPCNKFWVRIRSDECAGVAFVKSNPCELIGSDSYSDPCFYPHSSYQFIRIQYQTVPTLAPTVS